MLLLPFLVYHDIKTNTKLIKLAKHLVKKFNIFLLNGMNN